MTARSAVALVAVVALSWSATAQQQAPTRDATAAPGSPTPTGKTPLPALSAEAQALVNLLKQNQDGTIEHR